MTLREKYSWDNPKFKPLREAARGVSGGFGNANKWLDTVQEAIYIETGMKHTADRIHGIAHKMLQWLDEFSDLLHERHLMTEYPTTEELETEIREMDDAFALVTEILDQVQERLEAFRDAAQREKMTPMSLKAEELMLKNSGEYTKVLAMWKMWEMESCHTAFDEWVAHMDEGGV